MRSAALPTLALAFILGVTACHDSATDHLTEPKGVPPAAVPQGPATSVHAITDPESGSCHFGDPVEIDEYNGLVYLLGWRQVPGGLEGQQVVDMWGVSPDFAEMPDDISWICNPEELEDEVELQLVAHDEYPDDIAGFSLVQIYDDIDNYIPSWYLAYRVVTPVGEDDGGAFRKRMVLKLWDPGLADPLVDSVPVTVTGCFHPALKSHCIQNELENE